MPYSNSIETSARLAIIEQCGCSVLILVDDASREALLGSRGTRAEVLRQLLIMARHAIDMHIEVQMAMSEIDWAGWRTLGTSLTQSGAVLDDALCYACESLVPATLLWLRVFRQSMPSLFQMKM